jgi:hypothetical protein
MQFNLPTDRCASSEGKAIPQRGRVPSRSFSEGWPAAP